MDKTIHQKNKFVMYHKNFIEFRIPLEKINAKKGDFLYFFFRDYKGNF